MAPKWHLKSRIRDSLGNKEDSMNMSEHLTNISTNIANMMINSMSTEIAKIDQKLIRNRTPVTKLENNAIKKVNKIIKFRTKHTNNKRIIPSEYSNNPVERSLGNKLTRLKTAKNRGTGDKFYPILQTIAENNNDPNLFEYVNNKQKAITKLINCLEKVKLLGKFPTANEDFDTWKFIRNLQYVKKGLLQGIWYPELDALAIEYGHPNLFKTNIEGTRVEVDIIDLMKFYKKHNKTPSQLSNDAGERALYRKLIRLKQIKQGKTVQIWNPELDNILRNAKMRNFFN